MHINLYDVWVIIYNHSIVPNSQYTICMQLTVHPMYHAKLAYANTADKVTNNALIAFCTACVTQCLVKESPLKPCSRRRSWTGTKAFGYHQMVAWWPMKRLLKLTSRSCLVLGGQYLPCYSVDLPIRITGGEFPVQLHQCSWKCTFFQSAYAVCLVPKHVVLDKEAWRENDRLFFMGRDFLGKQLSYMYRYIYTFYIILYYLLPFVATCCRQGFASCIQAPAKWVTTLRKIIATLLPGKTIPRPCRSPCIDCRILTEYSRSLIIFGCLIANLQVEAKIEFMKLNPLRFFGFNLSRWSFAWSLRPKTLAMRRRAARPRSPVSRWSSWHNSEVWLAANTLNNWRILKYIEGSSLNKSSI